MSKKNKDIITLDDGTKVTPFNLKRALRGDDIVCRNGSKVNNLTDLFKDNLRDYCIVGSVNAELKTFNDDGKFCASIGNCGQDLFMVYKEKPKKDKKVKNKDNKKTKRWVNVYWASHDAGCEYENSQFFLTKEIAIDNVPYYAKEHGSYIKTIKITF